MGNLFPQTLIYLSLSLSLLVPARAQTLDIKSAKILDSLIRDYTLRSYTNNTFKTGKLFSIDLPTHLSGVDVDAIRLRCGSLLRHGSRIKEFYLESGINVNPCIERVILVRQSVASNWSSVYNKSYQLSGYRLVSPVLGLLAYSVGNPTVPTGLKARSGQKQITVDFSGTRLLNKSRITPLCASFDLDGKVTLSDQERPNVCVATREGHFGLVVESPLMPLKGKVGKVKIVVVSSIGAALGAFLLSLLLVAMLVKAKKKARMEEMERRAYEEEALQVSMVGHVRAVTAPKIEQHHYRLRHS